MKTENGKAVALAMSVMLLFGIMVLLDTQLMDMSKENDLELDGNALVTEGMYGSIVHTITMVLEH